MEYILWNGEVIHDQSLLASAVGFPSSSLLLEGESKSTDVGLSLFVLSS